MKTNQTINYSGYAIGDFVWVFDIFLQFTGTLEIKGIEISRQTDDDNKEDCISYYLDVPIISEEAKEEYGGKDIARRYMSPSELFNTEEECYAAALKEVDECIKDCQAALDRYKRFKERLLNRGTE